MDQSQRKQATADIHYWLYPSFVWLIQLLIALITTVMFAKIIHPYQQPLQYFWSWDGAWYLAIADHGYAQVQNTAFFPAYPIAIYLTHLLTSLPLRWCGVIVSNLSLWAALMSLYRLITNQGHPRHAKHTLWLLIVFPTAFFFNCVYTESLSLLTIVLFFYCLQQDRWYLAMVSGFFAAITHGFNVLLVFAALAYLWRQRQQLSKSKLIIYFFSIALIPLSILLYMGYLYIHFGDALMFLRETTGRHRYAVIPILYTAKFVVHLLHHPLVDVTHNIVNLIHGSLTLLMVLLGILMLSTCRQIISLEQKVFYILYLLVATSATASYELQSFARYMLVLFPGFIVWAHYSNRQWLLLSSIGLMLPLKAILLGMFVNGYWIT